MSIQVDSKRISTLDGFLRQFVEQHKQRPDQPFCFILGAGASRDSGIPTGGEMAEAWLKKIHQNRNHGKATLEAWASAENLGIAGFNIRQPARHYSQLYELLYENKDQQGYAYLESVMEGKEPSFGYSVLSYLLGETQHRIIITTNFDNLVTDALAIHSGTFPIVVNEDSLVHYVRANVHRPLVAKIHGSLGFKPKSRGGDLRLSEGWKKALASIFKTHTPIVIGYDGNDGSLMTLLEEIDGDPEFIWWCFHCEIGHDPIQRANEQPERVKELVNKRPAEMVPIPGFDYLMLKLLSQLESELGDKVPDLTKRLEDRSSERLGKYKQQKETLGKKLAEHERASDTKEKSGTGVAPSILTVSESEKAAGQDGPKAKENLSAEAALLARDLGTKPWWQWQLEIDSEKTVADKDARYRQAIEQLPASAPLLGNYANFLNDIRQDYDGAEAFYKRAIEADPKHANHLGNYANFLNDIRQDYDGAEAFYKRAIEADPKYANNLSNYANFLNDIRQDYDGAEAFYKRAIEADPKHANNLGNYGQFFLGRGKTLEAMKRLRDAKRFASPGNVAQQAEISFSLWAGSCLAGMEEPAWERVFKHAILKGFQRSPWSFDSITAQVKAHLPAEVTAYIQALAAAFLDETKVPALEEFPRWKALEPLNPSLVSPDGSISSNPQIPSAHMHQGVN